MRLVRAPALLGLLGVLLTQAACPLEPDPQPVEHCKPGEIECITNDRTRTCNEDGQWGAPETFVCPGGSCMIMGDAAVCM